MLSEHPHRSQVTDVEDAEVVLYDVLGVHRTNGSDLGRSSGGRSRRGGRQPRPASPTCGPAHWPPVRTWWISMSVDSHQLIDAVEAAAQGQDLPGAPTGSGARWA